MEENKKTGASKRKQLEKLIKIAKAAGSVVGFSVITGLSILGKNLIDNTNQTEWDKIMKKIGK